MRAAFRTLLAALAAAALLTGVPAAAATPGRLLVVERVRDTVSVVCANHDGKVACHAVHRPRAFLVVTFTTVPAPPAPRPRAPHLRTPPASPGLP